MTEAYRHRIEAVLTLAAELHEAFENEKWDEVEALLQKRNLAAEQAFTADLPTNLHKYARDAFEQLRKQDQELKEKAELLQKDLREELMQINKSKKSIEAYQV
ncbi:flagellar protein FliT [Pseudomaricurvus sp.]|uniref:flagellar protein FliT n=1 Tax=Pseudomaricurvus sp. TaxID=2004510 RepID=UPI003F6D29BC